ncbi:MAG: hypothetical protein ACLVFA_04540 [Butyricicoccus sp.]
MRISDTHPIVEDKLKLFREGKVDEVFCATRSLSLLCSRSRSASSCCPRTLTRQTSSRQALMF